MRRLERILDNDTGRMVFIALDDGLLDGPVAGLADQRDKVKQIVDGGADSILGFKGLLTQQYPFLKRTGVILNLTASSKHYHHTEKVLIGSVEEALRLGADGVAVHVNVTSRYQPEMLKMLGMVSEKCYEWGVPLMALMYPRREKWTDNGWSDDNYVELKRDRPDEYALLVAEAARIGVELGADIIKTQYTGSPETFSKVVGACGDVPVIIAGGPKVEPKEILQNVYDAIQAGGKGVCIGRNAFSRDDTQYFVKALRAIVHEEKTVDEALTLLP